MSLPFCFVVSWFCKINKFINWISYFILVHQTCRLSLAGTHHPVAILPTENGTCWAYRENTGPQSRLHFLQGKWLHGHLQSPRASFLCRAGRHFQWYILPSFARCWALCRWLQGSALHFQSCSVHSNGHILRHSQFVYVFINSFTKSMGSTEIHRSTFYLQYLSGRNGYFIDGYIKSALMVTILFKTVGEGLAIPARLKKP